MRSAKVQSRQMSCHWDGEVNTKPQPQPRTCLWFIPTGKGKTSFLLKSHWVYQLHSSANIKWSLCECVCSFCLLILFLLIFWHFYFHFLKGEHGTQSWVDMRWRWSWRSWERVNNMIKIYCIVRFSSMGLYIPDDGVWIEESNRQETKDRVRRASSKYCGQKSNAKKPRVYFLQFLYSPIKRESHKTSMIQRAGKPNYLLMSQNTF